MAKLIRKFVAKGMCHDVECAVLSDGSSPAWDFLHALEIGMWEPDPDAESLPSDEQIADRAKFFSMAKRLADTGLPTGGAGGTQTNDLQSGIWEFKSGRKRLSWYDTDGQGGFVEKRRVRTRADSEDADDDAWWFPRFDSSIRLGHAFPKTGALTEDLDIDETIRTRTEDLAHDGPS